MCEAAIEALEVEAYPDSIAGLPKPNGGLKA